MHEEALGWSDLQALAADESLTIDRAEVSGEVYSCWIEGRRFDVPLADLVAAYWEHMAHHSDPDMLAFELVHDLAQEHRSGLVDAIRALADAVSGDQRALALLGAGVLEDSLRYCRQPPSPTLVDELDAAARQHPDVRVAVQLMWWAEDDPNRERFERFGRLP
jgi:hypothetical protein